MKTNQRTKKKHPTRKTQRPDRAEARLTFLEHLYELRKRLVYIICSVLVFSTLAYFVQQQIVNFLLEPAKGQQFIYTSPGGGINFLFTICTYVGIAASMPVIIYQVLGFFAPLIKHRTRHSIIRYSYFSGVLAVLGFCCGYFIGLPAALHFLSHQFESSQVHPLFTIQEYMSFLMIYLLGSVLLFQLPIIILFINRIKPIPPRKLLGAERYVIVAAFIIAMIMAPTPNILDQFIIAGPVIVMYNLSLLMIWVVNRHNRRPGHVIKLLEQDQRVQADRLQKNPAPLVAEPLPDNRKKLIGVHFAGNNEQTIDVRVLAA